MTPGEVESAIAAHRDVLRCVVFPAAAGQRRFVAHYVLRQGARLSAAELLDYLERTLLLRPEQLVLRRHALFPPTWNGTLQLTAPK